MSLTNSPDVFASAESLLRDLLDVSLTGVNFLRPLYGSGGELEDFTVEYLNPAAQRITGLSEQPAGTARTFFPGIFTNGVFDFYRRVFETGEAGRYDFNDQTDGFDNYFHLAARRSGERLVVSFTDTSDPEHRAVAQALRESQAAEKAARAEAELQRQRLQDILMQLPAQVAINRGPDHVFEFVNPRYQQLFPARSVLGKPAREVLPELEGQQFFEAFEHVYQTGEPFYGLEMAARVDYTNQGRLDLRYFDVFFQALRDAQGTVDGILNFAYDVTEQVRARRQAEQLNEELAAANEEFLVNNAELLRTQQELRQLNQELEAHVQARTQEAQNARAEAEAQRAELQRVFEQAPVAIAIVRGPDFIVELANPTMGALWGRPLAQIINRPHFDALPDARGQGLEQIFRRVLHTGEPFTAVEMPVTLVREQAGRPAQGYFNCTWQPLRDAQGQITGLIIVGVEVTEQVLARQQAEALQAELLAAAEHQAAERETFYQIFEQTPASIVLLRGPEHRVDYHNEAYQQLFPNRRMRGRTIAEIQPDALDQGFVALLDRVYQTGETFYGRELQLDIDQPDGQRQETYFNFTYQAYRENGQIVGVSVFAYDVTELVRARRQREAQQWLLDNVFELAPAGIWVVQGPDYVFEFINPAMTRILGHSAEQVLGRPYFEVLPELRSQGLPELFRQVQEQGESVFVEELPAQLAYHAPGEVGYFTFVFQPLRDEHGRVARISCVALDVTTQVLARQKVEESKQQVQAVVAASPYLIGVYEGPEFRIQLANQAMLDAMGKGPDVIGRRYAEVLPELEDQAVFGQLQQVFTTGQPLHVRNRELKVVMNGIPQTFHYNYSFTPLRDTQGRVYGILNTGADVTDLVLARRRADEAAAELRLLTAHAPAFLFRTDPAGHISYVNDALFEWSGLNPAALTSLNDFWHIVHPEDFAALQASFGAAIAAGQAWESVPYRIRRRDGQYRWSITRTQPYLGPNDEVAGHSGINIEIHEQVELQRQLQRTNADLDNFIYTASHDLKAPISNIEGLLLALEHELPPASRVDDVPVMLELMHGAVERFKRTIAHLTDISRLQKEHDQPSQSISLATVVEEVRLDLLPLITETQARVEVDVAACPTVQFSEKNLRSIVYNLLSNALKYRHPEREPHVQVRCRPEAEYLVLEVQDNGLGLDLSQGQERLFAMFQRLHTHVEGTGVGLYMVKKMVENVGGRIRVQSQLGQGSTFAVCIPQ